MTTPQMSHSFPNLTTLIEPRFTFNHSSVFFQLELSWFGSDDESGIHTYEVGLGSTGSEDVDLMPYTSTHGHRHFTTYHPDLMDGQTFYIHIKAVNRAGQQTVQVSSLSHVATHRSLTDRQHTLRAMHYRQMFVRRAQLFQ